MRNSDRHLSVDSFEEFVRRAVPLEHPVPGDPRLILFIDPLRREVGLRAPATIGEPRPQTGLEHVRLRPVQRGIERFLEIVITDPQLFTQAYPVLCAAADRVQLQGLSLGAALSDTIRILGRLLERTDSLSIERELGLFGELMLFLGLIRGFGGKETLQAWRGAEREEHDFGLAGHDIEVKTTNGERRTHWIGSLTQLVPSGNRPLWVVSHQLTKAESSDGRTLADLVDAARLGVGHLRGHLDLRLHAAGWRNHHAQTGRTRWRRRVDSAVFAVVDGFPCLTPAKLTGVPLARIPDVRYRVDLTDQPVGAAVPSFLFQALNHGEIA